MKKNIIKQTSLSCWALVVIVLGIFGTGITSCSTTDPYDIAESTKDLSGVWKLQTVVRNGIDITEDMDFSQFVLNLKADGTYSIENYLPFVVKEDGTWSLDNPTMPFMLCFKEASQTQSVDVELNYPIIDGHRSLSIKLSPGCGSNTYSYQLMKVAN